MFVNGLCFWQPPKEDLSAAPKLEWTEPIFRRRLSQLTKMTVQVTHDLFEKSKVNKNTKIVFISFRGELEREYKVNKTLIQEDSILPAAFSLSVFNAPIAQATIALGLKGGYNAIFPSQGNFKDGILAAAAPVLAGIEEQIVLVYADENIPDYYKDFFNGENFPLAFAAVLSSQKLDNSIKCELEDIPRSPREFIQAFKK